MKPWDFFLCCTFPCSRLLILPDWVLGGQGHPQCHGVSKYSIIDLYTKFQLSSMIGIALKKYVLKWFLAQNEPKVLHGSLNGVLYPQMFCQIAQKQFYYSCCAFGHFDKNMFFSSAFWQKCTPGCYFCFLEYNISLYNSNSSKHIIN